MGTITVLIAVIAIFIAWSASREGDGTMARMASKDSRYRGRSTGAYVISSSEARNEY